MKIYRVNIASQTYTLRATNEAQALRSAGRKFRAEMKIDEFEASGGIITIIEIGEYHKAEACKR